MPLEDLQSGQFLSKSFVSTPKYGPGVRTIKSMCGMCLHGCGIDVRTNDGVVVRIEGDQTNPDNMGHICPRGNSGVMRLYDTNRVKHPIVRTNPKKGFDEDPGWQKVSWEEAIDLICDRLGRIRKDDPRKLLCSFGDFQRIFSWLWPFAFGAMTNRFTSRGTYCGAGYHPINGMVHVSFAAAVDYEYCNYLIQIGSGDGFESHLHLPGSAQRVARAMERGMKLVVVDPRLSVAASKANEWIPIRPATDGAFALGLINVLLNNLKIYDGEYIAKQTNGPYLVREDGYFLRDKSGKPLVWDSEAGEARVFDDPRTKRAALEGSYQFGHQKCKPSFQSLKEAVVPYSPSRVEEITTIPANTLTRIAKEYGEAASIGSTVVLDEKEYPLRPAAIQYYRGAHSHKHSMLINMSLKLANMIIGNIDVPGGHIGVAIDDKGKHIEPGEDGMLKPLIHHFYRPTEVKFPPDTPTAIEWFPVGYDPGHLAVESVIDPNVFGLTYQPDSVLIFHSNPLRNLPGTDRVRKAFEKLNFIASMDIIINDSSLWADVILPDHSYLESFALGIDEAPEVTGIVLRQPVVEPIYDSRDGVDILTELSERLEFLDRWNGILNSSLGLSKKPNCCLELDRKYRVEEILDRYLRATYGDEYGLEWFKIHGHNMRKLTTQEKYLPYGRLRIPLYFELILRAGDEMKMKMKEQGIRWDTSDYLPVPVYRPSPVHEESPEYDMYAIDYKVSLSTSVDSWHVEWLKDIGVNNPYIPFLLLHPDTASKKHLSEGDRITLRSPHGEVKGTVKITEGIHPEVVGMTSIHGEGATGQPPGSRAHFNSLLSPTLKYTDYVSGAIETTARVKIVK